MRRSWPSRSRRSPVVVCAALRAGWGQATYRLARGTWWPRADLQAAEYGYQVGLEALKRQYRRRGRWGRFIYGPRYRRVVEAVEARLHTEGLA